MGHISFAGGKNCIEIGRKVRTEGTILDSRGECDNYMKMKSTYFWDITPCSPLRVNRRFGGTYHHPRWFLVQLIFRA
jgi:hypothetical protein